MWVKPSVMNSNDILTLSFSSWQESKQVSRGNIDCLRGPFMKSSAVTTSVDAIWRSRKHCYFSNREGTRHLGSIKTIMAIFFSKCWAMPETKTRNVDWGILSVCVCVGGWGGGWGAMTGEVYPLVAHNNSKKHFLWWHLTWHVSTLVS